jgi:hypothetical protein
MNQNMLYKEIGLIDDDLIMEADYFQNTKSFLVIWKKAGLAACFAVIILVSIFLPRLTGEHGILSGRDFNIKKPGNSISSPDVNKNSLIFNKATGLTDSNICIPGHFWQELTENELRAVLPGISDSETTATANFRGDGTLFNIDIRTKIKSGMEAYIQLAPGEPVLDYVLDVNPTESKVNEVPVLAGYYEGNSGTIYFAKFKLYDVGYYLEFQVDAKDTVLIENAKEMFTELIFHIISGGAADFSVLNPVIPELRDDKLSLKESYADEDFGAYLPRTLPSGFTLESSFRFINQESNCLSALWCKGLNDIRWQVSKVSEADEIRITSVSDTKNYDLALYPIPRAESVPEELREIVNNPIFRIDDLTLEAVKTRAYTSNDKGDEKGYRMRFSVLYDGGILVEINVKDAEPEYIFNQLRNINHSMR